MTGPITFSGLGSGLDIESIVTGLVNASSQPVKTAQTKASDAQAAITTLSGVSSLLSDLRTVVQSLDTATELSSYSGTSSSPDAVSITTTGAARPATYNITDITLAQEQRNYTDAYADKGSALLNSGTMSFTQDGANYSIAVESTDTLENIGAKINGMGASITASIVSTTDGYRLQIRSKTTGDKQAFTVDESGLTSKTGVNGDTAGAGTGSGKYQSAHDSSVTLDGLKISSSTNTITDAVGGVTLELKQNSSTPISVAVSADSSKMQASLTDFVTKYNNVIARIHSISGFGSTKGSSTSLQGDASLRSITNALSSQVLSGASTGGALNTLADIGIRLNNDGTLRVDSDAMGKALNDNPDGFSKVLAGDETKPGVMDMMSDLLKGFTQAGTGLLSVKTESLNSSIKLFQATADREQKRLDAMELRLRSTFSAMDAQMGYNNVQMSYLASL